MSLTKAQQKAYQKMREGKNSAPKGPSAEGKAKSNADKQAHICQASPVHLTLGCPGSGVGPTPMLYLFYCGAWGGVVPLGTLVPLRCQPVSRTACLGPLCVGVQAGVYRHCQSGSAAGARHVSTPQDTPGASVP